MAEDQPIEDWALLPWRKLVGHAAFNAAFPEAKSHAAGRRSIPGLFAA